MNDIVLQGFVERFAEERGLPISALDEAFEAFAASSLLRKYHQSSITDIDEGLLVGGAGDGGLDAVAILVNGRPARTEEDVQFFVDHLGRLDVEFVFIQAKTSAAFRAADIGSFVFGVEQFFSQIVNATPNIEFRSEIQDLIDLTHHIYHRHGINLQGNPKCYLYYVTTGNWTDAPDPKGRLLDGEQRLLNLNIFSAVRSMPVDAELLKATYRELERRIVKDVEFSRTAVFPRIEGVDEAYIGLLPGNEFIKLVSTDDGDLNRELFYDNVRDFQGHNPVNREIEQTLSDQHLRNNFPLLNNGITIIARSIHRTAETFRLSDFQIVNGCQTTHMLFQNKSIVDAGTFIPIKIVATNDSSIVTDVIKATNRQTAVLPEALESLTPFHKELEDFYAIQEAVLHFADRIYYERRSKQYAMDNIKPSNIVTLTGQIKSFISMFLDEPHSHPRYYGELLKSYEGRIFVNNHRPEPYYASGIALLTVEKWLNGLQSERELRQYKHQLLMTMRMLINGHDMPRLNNVRIADYSLRIVEVIRDPTGGPDLFATAVELVKGSLERFSSQRSGRSTIDQRNPPHRLRAFTEQLKEDARVEGLTGPSEGTGTVASPGDVEQGVIRFFDDIKRYRFIGRDGGDDIFVHESEILAIPYHLRVRDMPVRYTVANNPRSPGMMMASGVHLFDPSNRG